MPGVRVPAEHMSGRFEKQFAILRLIADGAATTTGLLEQRDYCDH
jgi:hypothetical protein